MKACDGNCFECKRPARQCYGGPRLGTAYTHPSQVPTKRQKIAESDGCKHMLNKGRINGKFL